MINFKYVSVAAACLYITLFLSLLLVPDFIFWIFDIDGDESARFISRRAAMLFFGFAVISWLGREASHSSMRQAVILGMAATMATMALTGLYEFARGYAGAGILLAVMAELAFAVAYGSLWKTHHVTTAGRS